MASCIVYSFTDTAIKKMYSNNNNDNEKKLNKYKFIRRFHVKCVEQFFKALHIFFKIVKCKKKCFIKSSTPQRTKKLTHTHIHTTTKKWNETKTTCTYTKMLHFWSNYNRNITLFTVYFIFLCSIIIHCPTTSQAHTSIEIHEFEQ